MCKRKEDIVIKNNKVILDVSNVSKIFPNKFQGLKDVSLTIYKGECFGLVGQSGSGKITLGRIMAGIIHATAGTVLFSGSMDKKTYLVQQGFKKSPKS
ncbi:ATP-binding cassette domain-containing protein ['Catharanthus roseus' aster yellows phytoplasma]|uniref:ATP-binding cassette domain-containing protein n=1 Tax='Catharanthus roseus' aster yellows phytoplasma TaxID=1193712 RepID=A0A4P6M8F1_9MOLU|nr:ATP-binding cassette domain-containing protein ['Catharanthus roseus' aster yellows phytoplasma]